MGFRAEDKHLENFQDWMDRKMLEAYDTPDVFYEMRKRYGNNSDGVAGMLAKQWIERDPEMELHSKICSHGKPFTVEFKSARLKREDIIAPPMKIKWLESTKEAFEGKPTLDSEMMQEHWNKLESHGDKKRRWSWLFRPFKL